MRQSLSNFRPRQREDFAPVFRALCLFNFISFYVVLDARFTPSTFISCLRRFSRFRLCFIFIPLVSRFSKFFFSIRLSSLLRRVHISVPVTGGGHYSKSRGVDYPPGPCSPHTLVRPSAFTVPASACSLVQAPAYESAAVPHSPASHTQYQSHIKSRKRRYRISE